MAAFNLAEEFQRPVPLPPGTPWDYLWERGQTITRAEAIEVVLAMRPEIPQWDHAAADSVLMSAVADGLLTTNRHSTYTRVLVDPEPREPKQDADGPAETTFEAFAQGGVRTVHVQTVEGEVVPLEIAFRIPYYKGPRSGYAAHVAKHRLEPFDPTQIHIDRMDVPPPTHSRP